MQGSVVVLMFAICQKLASELVQAASDPEVKKSPKFYKVRGDGVLPPVPADDWFDDGECVNNPVYVDDCKVWAEKGYCTDRSKGEHYPRWMKRNCAESCGLCQAGNSWWKLAFKSILALLALFWALGWLRSFGTNARPVSLSRNRAMFRFLAFVVLLVLLYFL